MRRTSSRCDIAIAWSLHDLGTSLAFLHSLVNDKQSVLAMGLFIICRPHV